MARKKIATWIKPKDRINVELIADVYAVKKSKINGWKYMQGSDRISVYEKKGLYTIVLKGTSAPLRQDLVDDFLLTLGQEPAVEQIKEGNILINTLLASGIDKSKITLTGHSLGGYSANSIGKTNGIQTVTFNAAAPPTAPVTTGGGKELSTNYHIVGDLISSHTSDDNALTIRANKNTNFFSTVWNHGLDRFYADDPTYSFWDSTKENSLFNRDKAIISTTPLSSALALVYRIPGSSYKPFQLYFQDSQPITRKEVNAAWQGQPINNYTPVVDDTPPVEDNEHEYEPVWGVPRNLIGEPDTTTPAPELDTVLPPAPAPQNTVLPPNDTTAYNLAMIQYAKQYAQYQKSLKSSRSVLKRPAKEPVLWRSRKEYSKVMRGRVLKKPRLPTISNKNV